MAVTTTRDVIAKNDLFIDYAYYREIAQSFLSDGTYYLSRQLSGPYDLTPMSDVLYPPSALLLFLPFAFIPAIFWWAIPITVTLFAVRRWRPSLAGIAIMLVLLSWPRAHGTFLFGNTDMWVMAGVAGGLRWGWPAALIALKPSLIPFALIGIRRRGWWFAAMGLVALGVAQLPMWLQYAEAITSVRASPGYGLGSLPLVIVPIIGWWTSRSKDRSADRGGAPRPSDSAG